MFRPGSRSSRPTVSVLLPVFNAAATLPACLKSLRRQTFPDWQCIVVNDGSEDDSLALARATSTEDSRFTVISTAHRGLVAALNSGLCHCQGPLIARMDADDVMHRSRLASQIATLDEDPTLAAVGTHVRMFPRAGLTEGIREYERWLNGIRTWRDVRCEAFIECPVAHPTLMIRADILTQMGYRDKGWAEDYDLILRLLSAGQRVSIVPERLLNWRDGPSRLSRVGDAYRFERFTQCKADFIAADFLATSAHYVLWGYGRTGKSMFRALRAQGKLPSHIVEVHPRRLGKVIQGAPVISYDALPALGTIRIVVAVAGTGPRQIIRDAMDGMGFEEVRDFICTA